MFWIQAAAFLHVMGSLIEFAIFMVVIVLVVYLSGKR